MSSRDIHPFARKHGISDTEALYAAKHRMLERYLDEGNPARQLTLGTGTHGFVLELVILVFDSGNELIIHAMPARRHYLKLLRS